MTPSNMTQTYNGWANKATWSVALWIGNDQFLYNTAKACVEYCEQNETPYDKFIRCMLNCENDTNGDGIAWDDNTVNRDEINDMMLELAE